MKVILRLLPDLNRRTIAKDTEFSCYPVNTTRKYIRILCMNAWLKLQQRENDVR